MIHSTFSTSACQILLCQVHHQLIIALCSRNARVVPCCDQWSRAGCHWHHTVNVVGSKLFIFGGQCGQKILDDMWTLDLNGHTFAYCCFKPFRPFIPTVTSQPV